MTYALQPGAGFRKYDPAAASAAEIAARFRGLPDGAGPAHALAAFKRAASYLSIPPSIVQLVDVLFAWTKQEDWQAAAEPIVWPRNEKLARKLGLRVRQVQNLLNRAVALRLISHRDSPNGHRGGVRAEDGSIRWAYGIVLSPIGARLEEFREVAERGSREDEAVDILKRRLTAARRKIGSLFQTVLDESLHGTDADQELALAQSAARQMRSVRDLVLLTGCVEQIEQRARALEGRVHQLLTRATNVEIGSEIENNTSTDVEICSHSTTTKKPQTAKAATSSLLSKRSSEFERLAPRKPTTVEDDLEKHGIGLVEVETVTADLCGGLTVERRNWPELVRVAEELADRHQIHRHAWHEATRLMGPKGAAAAVIATVRKYRDGEVQRPGAYLRGMSARAANGELHLGRTFHGFRESQSTTPMRALREGQDPSSIGALLRRTLKR